MEINALLMDEKDNVVTCVTEVPAGQDLVYRKGDQKRISPTATRSRWSI